MNDDNFKRRQAQSLAKRREVIRLGFFAFGNDEEGLAGELRRFSSVWPAL
jgi:hypothetical protein